ncbi:hypothetical protein ACQVTX_02710 [Bacillus pretiosus]|uniref:hypothetical protein n=1 Tax=Bacillus pretiosus TaxID=2983392 RepID=UPI003D64B045
MLFKESNQLSRRFLANKHQSDSIHKRLILNNSTDLRNNIQIKDLQNGFMQISPLDESKKYSGN